MGVVQQDAPQAHPHASLLPLLEPSLTGSATPESQGEGEGTPGQPPAQDVQNAGQGLAGGDTGASTVGTRWGRWKDTLREVPEIVGNQRFDHSITLVQPNCPQPLRGYRSRYQSR